MSSQFNNPTNLSVDLATGRLTVAMYVYDTNLLDWVPSTTNGGGSPGENVNVTNPSIAVTQAGSWTVSTGGLTDAQLRASAVPVSGTFYQATQPVSGTFWQATQPVSIASMPSTPVTGTFWQATQPISIASMPSTPVTGTFWQATQPVSMSSLPTLPGGTNTIGSVKLTDGTSTATIGNLTNNKALATMIVDGTGAQITSFGGGTQYADGTTNATPTGTVALGKNASNVLHALSLDASGYLNINLAAGSISGNSAAGPTGSAVPASASYTGYNSAGNLVGVSTSNPLPVAQQGSLAVTGTFWQLTQPVSLASSVGTTEVALAATGTITASAQTVVLTGGQGGSIQLIVYGTFTGTLTVESSADGSTWFAIQTYYNGWTAGVKAYTLSSGTDTNLFADGLSRLNFRVRCTAYTSGTANIRIYALPVAASPNISSQNQSVAIGDPLNVGSYVSLKLASTAAVAADKSLVIAHSPNSPLPAGTNTIGGVTTPSTISTANSTTTNLAAAAVFTGTSEDVSNYAEVRVMVYSSHASATDGLSLQQSTDGSNWFQTDVWTIPATTSKVFGVGVAARYFRLVYTNGGTLTTTLQIQTIYHVSRTKPSAQRPGDAYSNEIDVEQVQTFPMLYNGTTWDRQRGTNGSVNTSLPAQVATGTLTGSGQSVSLAGANFPSVLVTVYGTFTGTVIVEHSADGANWVAIDSYDNGWQTIGRNLTLTNGFAFGSFEYTPVTFNIRARCSAYTSGTGNVSIKGLQSALNPVINGWSSSISIGDFNASGRTVTTKAASTAAVATDIPLVVALHPSSPLPAGSNSIGTVTTTPTTPTASIINSAATTNGTVVKASAGTLYSITCSNINAATRYVKFYNSTTVTVGTTTPAITIAIPTNGTVNIPFAVQGMRFGTGICLGITGAAADSDTTAVAAGDVKVLTSYI